MESQIKMVLDYLKQGNKITQADAIRKFGAYRLSAIIFELRKEYNIKTEIKTAKNRFGKPVNFAEYSLEACYESRR